MQMGWRDLALFHWRVSPETLRPHIPAPLQLDTWEGEAWIGVVPFWMEEVRMRWAPPIPSTHRFPELNVRTYVRSNERRGVWFFSLDATSKLAVRAARLLNLPYFDAEIQVSRRDGAVVYQSRRTHRQSPAAALDASYRPVGDVRPAEAGSLEHWLAERYCLFTETPAGKIRILDIHHPPWPLQKAEAEIRANTMSRTAGIDLSGAQPLAHYAQSLDVLAWRPRIIREQERNRPARSAGLNRP